MTTPWESGLQLRSLVTSAGQLQLSLERVETPTPAEGEVVVQVQASPINPSDLGLLIGLAFSLFYSAMMLPMAWLADTRSRRKTAKAIAVVTSKNVGSMRITRP